MAKPNAQQMNKRRNNQILVRMLNNVMARVYVAKDIEQITAQLDRLHNASIAIKFNNSQTYFAVFAVIAAALTYFFLQVYPRFGNFYWYDFAVLIVSVGLTAWFVSSISRRSKKIAQTSQVFIDQVLTLLYKIKPMPLNYCDRVLHAFFDFQRGNHSRKITWAKSFEIEHEGEVIEAIAVRLHYVDVRTVTTTSMQGKRMRTRHRKVYDHYDREGIILPNKFELLPMIISQDKLSKYYKQDFSPSSIAFSESFNVQSVSELDAAKLLGPSAVTSFNDLAKEASGITFEISPSHGVLVSQKHKDILNYKARYSVSEPLAFKKELLTQLDLPLLNCMIGFSLKLFSTQGK